MRKSLGGKENPSYKHGLSKTIEYNRLSSILGSMKCRCYNKNNKKYKNYGNRGIKICDEWLEPNGKGLLNFYYWAINNGYKIGLSIDRVDNNGNYEPSNCRWVTNKKQSNNRRNNHYLTYKGQTHTMMEWSEILNISYFVIRSRINTYNWSVAKTFETPIRKAYNENKD